MKARLHLLFAGALSISPVSCAFAADHLVEVGRDGLTFTPGLLTIDRGDTVTFANIIGNHNVVANSGLFRCANGCDNSGGNGNLSTELWRATVQFDHAGTFGYYCQAHGDPDGTGMTGTIHVVGTAAFAIAPSISGNWYDPTQNGHGLQLEMTGPALVTAFWFTWDSAGNPAWLVGTGNAEGNRVVMNVTRPAGGRFPPGFDPDAIASHPWGTWTLTFANCNSGTLQWTTNDPAFTANGTMPLARLTSIAGAVCE